MVRVDFRPRTFARCSRGDCVESVRVEMLAHVVTSHIPDGEQHALSFVVAGAILMGLPEVAEGDGAIDS